MNSLDKLDAWNIYKSCLVARLSHEVTTFDLSIRGEDVQKNCEGSYQLEDLFPHRVVALLNYLHKLPFSGENLRAVKIFVEFCEFLEELPLLTKEEVAILVDIQSSCRGAKSIFAVFSLVLLAIPSRRRAQLSVVLRLLDKLFLDDYNGLYFDTAVERVAGLVINGEQAVDLLHLLLADIETILGVDKKFSAMVEEAKEELLKKRMSEKLLDHSSPLSEIPPPVAPKNERKNSNEDLHAVLDFLNELEEEKKEEKPQKKKNKGFFSKVLQKTKI